MKEIKLEFGKTIVKILHANAWEAGIGIAGASSYPILPVETGLEIWAYCPNKGVEEEEWEHLARLVGY